MENTNIDIVARTQYYLNLPEHIKTTAKQTILFKDLLNEVIRLRQLELRKSNFDLWNHFNQE